MTHTRVRVCPHNTGTPVCDGCESAGLEQSCPVWIILCCLSSRQPLLPARLGLRMYPLLLSRVRHHTGQPTMRPLLLLLFMSWRAACLLLLGVTTILCAGPLLQLLLLLR